LPSNHAPHSSENSFASRSNPSKAKVSTRVGDGKRPGREFHMARLGKQILRKDAPSILMFGCGLSRDHALASEKLTAGRVAVCDLGNFQDAADFIPMTEKGQQFDIVVACEVIEHFYDLDADFENLFSKVSDNGIVIASTNISNGRGLRKSLYPFSTGHTSYHSGRGLTAIAARHGFKVDFRAPAQVSPRKRFVLFYRDPEAMTGIALYFADHAFAPFEKKAPSERINLKKRQPAKAKAKGKAKPVRKRRRG
jgi:SAM-dependent methyltransferase